MFGYWSKKNSLFRGWHRVALAQMTSLRLVGSMSSSDELSSLAVEDPLPPFESLESLPPPRAEDERSTSYDTGATRQANRYASVSCSILPGVSREG